MCFPKAPEVKPASPPPSPQEFTSSEEVLQAREKERQRLAAAAGLASTIKTSPQGVTGEATTSKKTVLG